MKTQYYFRSLGFLLVSATLAHANSGTSTLTIPVFSASTSLINADSSLGANPLSGSWSIPQYTGQLADLVCVTLEIKTTVGYEGVLEFKNPGTPYQVQVRSHFKVDFGTTMPGNVLNIDPVVLLSGNSPNLGVGILGDVGGTNMVVNPVVTLTSALDLAAYVGAGQVSVLYTGDFLRTPPDNFYHNNDLTEAGNQLVYIQNTKVLSGGGNFSLGAEMTVTYYVVPEADVSAVSLLGLAAGWGLWRRQRK